MYKLQGAVFRQARKKNGRRMSINHPAPVSCANSHYSSLRRRVTGLAR